MILLFELSLILSSNLCKHNRLDTNSRSALWQQQPERTQVHENTHESRSRINKSKNKNDNEHRELESEARAT